ncbi:uncharacterized protein BYT42DRAFT_543336 [Radiomyces spectabilis]|uniref:uncharacterized protein n=1 Tax=Radiomyces spectabilis TaxID=64574 RepID=UPI00221F0CCB|nr:uncharacterized protein BYT42DRAFT_543336 [Radiomyces spectabilis]KAI8387947.1 hypothetical protein BYT42DRAFT_543336 [Radiomyces spectabilis]
MAFNYDEQRHDTMPGSIELTYDEQSQSNVRSNAAGSYSRREDRDSQQMSHEERASSAAPQRATVNDASGNHENASNQDLTQTSLLPGSIEYYSSRGKGYQATIQHGYGAPDQGLNKADSVIPGDTPKLGTTLDQSALQRDSAADTPYTPAEDRKSASEEFTELYQPALLTRILPQSASGLDPSKDQSSPMPNGQGNQSASERTPGAMPPTAMPPDGHSSIQATDATERKPSPRVALDELAKDNETTGKQRKGRKSSVMAAAGSVLTGFGLAGKKKQDQRQSSQDTAQSTAATGPLATGASNEQSPQQPVSRVDDNDKQQQQLASSQSPKDVETSEKLGSSKTQSPQQPVSQADYNQQQQSTQPSSTEAGPSREPRDTFGQNNRESSSSSINQSPTNRPNLSMQQPTNTQDGTHTKTAETPRTQRPSVRSGSMTANVGILAAAGGTVSATTTSAIRSYSQEAPQADENVDSTGKRRKSVVGSLNSVFRRSSKDQTAKQEANKTDQSQGADNQDPQKSQRPVSYAGPQTAQQPQRSQAADKQGSQKSQRPVSYAAPQTAQQQQRSQPTSGQQRPLSGPIFANTTYETHAPVQPENQTTQPVGAHPTRYSVGDAAAGTAFGPNRATTENQRAFSEADIYARQKANKNRLDMNVVEKDPTYYNTLVNELYPLAAMPPVDPLAYISECDNSANAERQPRDPAIAQYFSAIIKERQGMFKEHVAKLFNKPEMVQQGLSRKMEGRRQMEDYQTARRASKMGQ